MQLAKDYTGFKNNVSAIDEFSRQLQAQDKYFNDKRFPANESGEEAFIKCNDIKSAEAYCPKRYKAMKAWIENGEKARITVFNISPIFDWFLLNYDLYTGRKR